MNRIFFYPDNSRYVLFTEAALSHMYAHAQRRLWQKEAGGEIFSSEPDSGGLVINKAAGPNPTDFRSRCAWKPDIVASDRIRLCEFKQNNHAIGLWHTHPEQLPSPSKRDRQTTRAYLQSFEGDRIRYLMVIIGNHGIIPAMGVWVASLTSSDDWIHLVETTLLNTSI